MRVQRVRDGVFMEQKRTSFREQLQFGEEGEHIISDFLMDKGVVIMPLYQFSAQESPKIFSKEKALISPDLLCYGDRVFFVEVKTKNQWVRWQGNIETGFNQKHYRHYLEVQQYTKQDVYVIFRHITEEPTGIYIVKLDFEPVRLWNGKTPSGRYIDKPFVFYPFTALRKIGDS